MTAATMEFTRDEVMTRLAGTGYVADPSLAMAVVLMARLERPLLLEGDAGVGKTEVAKSLAEALGTDLIRLQCYEGLDAHSAVYEWNYQHQLLAIKIREAEKADASDTERHIFQEDYLLRRPLLQAISQDRPPVLLVDEIDRADEEFEAYLLEVLSEFSDHHSGTRHHHIDIDPLCGPDVERHAGAVRRPAPPLPLPLCRLPGRGQGAAHPDRPGARHRAGPGRPDRPLRAVGPQGGSA